MQSKKREESQIRRISGARVDDPWKKQRDVQINRGLVHREAVSLSNPLVLKIPRRPKTRVLWMCIEKVKSVETTQWMLIFLFVTINESRVFPFFSFFYDEGPPVALSLLSVDRNTSGLWSSMIVIYDVFLFYNYREMIDQKCYFFIAVKLYNVVRRIYFFNFFVSIWRIFEANRDFLFYNNCSKLL